MALNTRKPTGRTSHPCILLEGNEKSGKSWMAAEFTGHERIGDAYWLQLAEGDADMYGAIPGADYEILNHDGTYATIHQSVVEAHAEAKRANLAGEPPVLLVVDTIGALWDLLSGWANNRAKESTSNRAQLAKDPNAEINVGPTYWNPAGDRWHKTMTLLLTFPGVVLLISRGKETALIGANGNPVAGKKDYRVEGHKSLGHQVSVVVRMTRGEAPMIVGGRSVKVDMRPEKYKPEPRRDFSLEWLLFTALDYDPATAAVRQEMELHPGSDAPDSEMAGVLALAIETAEDLKQLKAAWDRIEPAANAQHIRPDEAAALSALVTTRKAALSQPTPEATDESPTPQLASALADAAGGAK